MPEIHHQSKLSHRSGWCCRSGGGSMLAMSVVPAIPISDSGTQTFVVRYGSVRDRIIWISNLCKTLY